MFRYYAFLTPNLNLQFPSCLDVRDCARDDTRRGNRTSGIVIQLSGGPISSCRLQMNDASSSPRHAKRAPGRQTRNRKESVFFFRRSRITVHDVKAITASNVSIRSSASFQVTNVRGKSRVTAVQGVDWSILPWLEAPCFFLLLLRDSSWTWQPIISKRGLSPKKNDR